MLTARGASCRVAHVQAVAGRAARTQRYLASNRLPEVPVVRERLALADPITGDAKVGGVERAHLDAKISVPAFHTDEGVAGDVGARQGWRRRPWRRRGGRRGGRRDGRLARSCKFTGGQGVEIRLLYYEL